MYYAGRRRSETNPLASIPLLRSVSILQPAACLPDAPPSSASPYDPPSDGLLRQRELTDAEAALAGLMNALAVARVGIGEANRSHTAPIVTNGHVVLPALRFSAARMRERKAYAFRLLNQRRGEVVAARRRVDAARAALSQPSLALLEERAAAEAQSRASKAIPVVARG